MVKRTSKALTKDDLIWIEGTVNGVKDYLDRSMSEYDELGRSRIEDLFQELENSIKARHDAISERLNDLDMLIWIIAALGMIEAFSIAALILWG